MPSEGLQCRSLTGGGVQVDDTPLRVVAGVPLRAALAGRRRGRGPAAPARATQNSCYTSAVLPIGVKIMGTC